MKKVEIYGAVVNSIRYASMYKEKVITAKVKGKKKEVVNVSKLYGKKKLIDVSWLKSASKKYEISPNLKDYVVEVVPVVTAEIPNINMQAFLLDTLTEFDPEHGCMRYKSFIGKPCFREHNNTDITQAKGVNLDATLVPFPKYKVAKVVVLSAFDRTKDTKLVKDIENRKRKNYSMGALASYFICSICGGKLGPGVVRTCVCPNTDYTNLASYGRIIRGKLHYILGGDPIFIENSSVDTPADISAVGTTI